MRAEAARPAISPMARKGSPASGSCGVQRRRPAVGHQEFAALAARCARCDRGRRRRAAAPTARRRSRRALPGRQGARPSPSGRGGRGRMRAGRCALPQALAPGAWRHPRAANDRAGRLRAGSRDRRASPPSPRSVSTTAISLAVLASPSRAASITMRASRGGSARLAIARPSSVMRPSPSMRADRRQQRARFLQRGARRRDRGRRASAGSATPQEAQSSTKPERSAERISGAA